MNDNETVTKNKDDNFKSSVTIYTCVLCNERTFNWTSMKVHILMHLQPDNYLSLQRFYRCDLCNKTMTTKYPGNFLRHLKIHLKGTVFAIEKRNFICFTCGEAFKEGNALKSHNAAKHNGPKPYRCDHCNRSYALRNVLMKHIRKTHLRNEIISSSSGRRIKEHRCTFCPKVFLSKESWQTHQYKHTDEKPFKCLICCKSYRDKKGLKIHLLYGDHASDKSCTLQCTECPKTFKLKHQLRGHVLNKHKDISVHYSNLKVSCLASCSSCKMFYYAGSQFKMHVCLNNYQMYSCDLCQLEFKKKTGISNHVLKHISHRYLCTLCNRSYSSFYTINRHLQYWHQIY